jgi:hypothetical protein
MAPDGIDDGTTRERALSEFVSRTRMLARQPGLDAAGAEVITELRAAGVEPVLLKGAALARSLYRPGEHRSYFDIDLLVSPDAMPKVAAVLGELGYASRNDLEGLRQVGDSLHADVWSRTVPGFGNQSFDVHWRVEGCGVSPRKALDLLTREAGFTEIAGCEVATLAIPAMALHLALHAAQHGPADAKAIGDLTRGIERLSEDVWFQARDLAGQLDALGSFAAGLRLAIPGNALADRLKLPTGERVLLELENRDFRPRGTFHLAAFRQAGWRERCMLIRHALLPPAAWIKWQHPWAGRGLIALGGAYLEHILRAPVWALRAWRYERRRWRT